MSESTRRQFLEVAGTAAAATFLAPTALAAGQTLPVPPLPVPVPPVPGLPVAPPPGAKSPAPAGPGAPWGSYQSEIYIAGMSAGQKPIFTTNLSDLEAAAAEVLSEGARRHLLFWAGGRAAVRANARALSAWRIVPRMFIDRAERDLSTTVLGVEMPAPVILVAVEHVRRGCRRGRAHRLPVVRPGLAGRERPGRRAAHARAALRVLPPRAHTPEA